MKCYKLSCIKRFKQFFLHAESGFSMTLNKLQSVDIENKTCLDFLSPLFIFSDIFSANTEKQKVDLILFCQSSHGCY